MSSVAALYWFVDAKQLLQENMQLGHPYSFLISNVWKRHIGYVKVSALFWDPVGVSLQNTVLRHTQCYTSQYLCIQCIHILGLSRKHRSPDANLLRVLSRDALCSLR